MAVLFFDTSALVRRYDSTEPGALAVRALCHPSANHRILISDITPVEVAAALNRKVRMGSFNPAELASAWGLFSAHLSQQYRVVNLNDTILDEAQHLPFQFNLRAYDSLQIASALYAESGLTHLTPDFQFCTADHNQSVAAKARGLTVQLIA